MSWLALNVVVLHFSAHCLLAVAALAVPRGMHTPTPTISAGLLTNRFDVNLDHFVLIHSVLLST